MHDPIERSDSSADRHSTDNRNNSNNMSKEVGYGPSGDDMRRMRGHSTANDLPGLTIEDPGNSGKEGNSDKGKHGPDQPSEADPQGSKSMGENVGAAISKAMKEHPELFKQLQEKQSHEQDSNSGESGLSSKDDEEHIGGRGHSRAI